LGARKELSDEDSGLFCKLQQRHAEEQKLLAEKQKQERQNQSKPQNGARPPEQKP